MGSATHSVFPHPCAPVVRIGLRLLNIHIVPPRQAVKQPRCNHLPSSRFPQSISKRLFVKDFSSKKGNIISVISSEFTAQPIHIDAAKLPISSRIATDETRRMKKFCLSPSAPLPVSPGRSSVQRLGGVGRDYRDQTSFLVTPD